MGNDRSQNEAVRVRIRRSVGARHAIAVNSCTAAMHLALEAIGLQRGDEVITTPYTFAATAEVVRYFDAKPVFVDVIPNTFNINPELIENAITSRTRAIIPIHIGGLPAEMEMIQSAPLGRQQISHAVQSFLAGDDAMLPLVRQLLTTAVWYEVCVRGRKEIFA